MPSSTVAFDEITQRLESLSSGEFLSSVSLKLQAEALKLVADGFRREQDPYGNAWAALKRRRGRILQDTGRLRASWAPVASSASGFRIGSNVSYAAAHQFGATYPARSEAKEQSIWQHPTTGRFVGRDTKLKAVVEHKVRRSFGERTLTARPMVPIAGRGLGTWNEAFKKIADRALWDAVK